MMNPYESPQSESPQEPVEREDGVVAPIIGAWIFAIMPGSGAAQLTGLVLDLAAPVCLAVGLATMIAVGAGITFMVLHER